MDRAVLAVDGDELGSRRRAHALHDRPGRDERLLVREREAFAGLQRSERDGQAREANHPVEHHIGGRTHVGEGRRPRDDLRAERHVRLELGGPGLVGDRDDLGAELLRLRRQQVDGRRRAQHDYLVRVGLGPHDVERLGSD